MSDETPTPADPETGGVAGAEQPAALAAAEPGAVATIEEPAAPAVATRPAEPITFTRKFLMPLLVPLAVTATIIFYVLNVSRIFLAGEDALAVTFAAIITVAILAGGAALSAAPRLRSSSLTLIVGGGLLVILMGGLISIGNASPKTASGPVECKPAVSKISVRALNTLRYSPSAVTAKAGCIQITLNIEGSHTLQFDDPVAANAFPQLDTSKTSWAGTLQPGTYKFHCTIPGHEAAGMVGQLTVTK